MEPFYIDSRRNSMRIAAGAAAALFLVGSDWLNIPMWVTVLVVFLIGIFFMSFDNRYYFYPDRIEKWIRLSKYESMKKGSDRRNGKEPIRTPFTRREPKEIVGQFPVCGKKGKQVSTYWSAGLQQVEYHEGRFHYAILLRFTGCGPLTERFFWLHALRNRKKAFVIRFDKKDYYARDYIRILELYEENMRVYNQGTINQTTVL